MARKPRHILPGVPHHIIQRGNRSQQVFFSPNDYLAYKSMLAETCRSFTVDIWAYCLMPNHVHLVAVPSDTTGLVNAISETHWRYARRINARNDWSGSLWQGRFRSYAMDELHLHMAVRYVELNPVRAGICDSAVDYPWSSAVAHMNAKNDDIVNVTPMLARVPDWQSYLTAPGTTKEVETIRTHYGSNVPLADREVIAKWELDFGLKLAPQKPGPKSRIINLD